MLEELRSKMTVKQLDVANKLLDVTDEDRFITYTLYEYLLNLANLGLAREELELKYALEDFTRKEQDQVVAYVSLMNLNK